MNNNAIGVFDSGLGGLTCVKELNRLLPNEDIIYLGDTARIPYGTRSKDTIFKYTKQDIAFLMTHNVKMIIVACGTMSSVMISRPVFEGIDIPHTGALIPAVQAACCITKNNRVGVIGTPATIRSGAYGKAIRGISTDIHVIGKACPLFVPLVENGYFNKDNKIATLVAEEYLEVMKKEKVDTLILGCTHYPLLSDIIRGILGDGVTLISPGAEAAKYASAIISEKEILADKSKIGKNTFYVTDSVEMFRESGSIFLGSDISDNVSLCQVEN